MTRLGHRVALQCQDEPSAAGQVPDTWTTYRHCWAAVTEGGGTEGGRASQQVATVRVSLLIRYPGEGRIPQPTDRATLTQNGLVRTLHISAVTRTTDRMRMLMLDCDEVQN